MHKLVGNVMIFAILLLSMILIARAEVDFSGEWRLDREKTELSQRGIFLVKLSVTQKGDSLLTERTYESGNGEQYPFSENLTLDGKEYQMTIYDMPRTCSVNRSNDGKMLLVKSKVIYYGDTGEVEMSINETWSLNQDGSELSIEIISKTPQGERTGSYFYKKMGSTP